jgi:hypothetical protein
MDPLQLLQQLTLGSSSSRRSNGSSKDSQQQLLSTAQLSLLPPQLHHQE